MDIPEVDSEGPLKGNMPPIHPTLLSQCAKQQKDDEVGRLIMAAGMYSSQRTPTLRQPISTTTVWSPSGQRQRVDNILNSPYSLNGSYRTPKSKAQNVWNVVKCIQVKAVYQGS